MEIFYNGSCRSLDEFSIKTPSGLLVISAKYIENNSIVFSASCAGEEVKLLLTLDSSGICTFRPVDETDNYPGTIIEPYSSAHWDNGFFHYASSNAFSFCQYADVRRMSVEARRNDIYLSVKFPARIREGIVVTEMDFKTNAYQMLMCIAKLAGYYTFERGQCLVLDSVCHELTAGTPKLTDTQLMWLEKEYPTAYMAYTTGVGVETVLPMLRIAISVCP